MSEPVWYLDSSAIVKLVVEERESRALMAWLEEAPVAVSCDLARVEVVRAVRPSGAAAVDRARRVLGALTMLRLDDPLLERAGGLEPVTLRSLDAIHLAACLTLGADLAGLVTYDARQAEAATGLGLRVEAPAP
ncbi:MAG: type II toxin-antitoxin system VapC family toxin [Deinococcales bacterium]